jgi:hypothetical protein
MSLALSAYSAKQFQIDMPVFKILEVYGSLYDEDCYPVVSWIYV